MSEKVASFAEAWIEILIAQAGGGALAVASFAEAWIEIGHAGGQNPSGTQSPPSRRRGLKCLL